MKRMLPCLLALLLLSGCAKEGNYWAEGQYVRGTSGRDYLIYETDHDGTWYILLEDASEEGSLLTGVEHGSTVSVQIGPRIDENEISRYTPIYACKVKQNWKSKEIPTKQQLEIDRIDALYTQADEG